jgi:hypothetical protein
VRSPIVDTVVLVGLDMDDKWGAGVEGCSVWTGEVDNANVEGVISEVDDDTDSVTGPIELDSSDADINNDPCVEEPKDVGVATSGDSTVVVGGDAGGDSGGREGGKGGSGGDEGKDGVREFNETEDATDGGSSG